MVKKSRNETFDWRFAKFSIVQNVWIGTEKILDNRGELIKKCVCVGPVIGHLS